MKEHEPAPQLFEVSDIQRETTRFAESSDRDTAFPRNATGMHGATVGMERAERLGHRLVSVSPVSHQEAVGTESVQRKTEDEENAKSLKQMKQESPAPRLKLGDYLERRRLGLRDPK